MVVSTNHIHLTLDNLCRAVIFTSFSFLSFSLQSKGYTRGVTKPQFARMLHFLSITVQPQDLAVSHSFPFFLSFYFYFNLYCCCCLFPQITLFSDIAPFTHEISLKKYCVS